jgi:hypothetical protein
MSDTPRTDEQNELFPMGGFTLDFARQLERELSDMTQRRDELLASLEKVITYLSPPPSGD